MANRQLLVLSPIVADIGYLLGVKADARTEAFFLRALADRDFIPVELTSDDYVRITHQAAPPGPEPIQRPIRRQRTGGLPATPGFP